MIKYISEIIKGIISLMQGLGVTLKHAFRKPITMQYPEVKADLPVRVRGRLVMPLDPEKNDNRCTACNLCVKACPNMSITTEKVMEEGKPKPKAAKYNYNLATCMFCNLCVEACPFGAIIMSEEYELATQNKSDLMIDLVAERYVLKGKKEKYFLSKYKEE